MSDVTQPTPFEASTKGPVQPLPVYESPRIERLGTLAELTQGGDVGPNDGFGGAGLGGSV